MARDISGRGMSPGELKKFEDGWVDMMSTIWQERMQLLGAVRTGRLRDSIAGRISQTASGTRTLQHTFLKYGIYLAAGAGPKGKRKPKEWFFRAYEQSIRKLNEVEAEAIGEEYLGLTFDTLRTILEGAQKKK